MVPPWNLGAYGAERPVTDPPPARITPQTMSTASTRGHQRTADHHQAAKAILTVTPPRSGTVTPPRAGAPGDSLHRKRGRVIPPPAALGYMPLGTGPAAPARAPTNSQCAPPLRFGSERRRYAGPRRRSRNERGRCCNESRSRRWVHAFGGIRSRHSGAAVSGGLCHALAFDPSRVGPCCPPARLGPGDAPPLSANLSGGAPVRTADIPLGYHDHAQLRLRATPPCRSEPLEILPPRRHGGTGHSGSRRSCVRPNRSSVCARLPIAPPQVFRRPDSAPARDPSGVLLRRIHV